MILLNKKFIHFIFLPITIFFFYALRLYLNVTYNQDFEILTFIPFLIVFCYGIVLGLQGKECSQNSNSQFSCIKNDYCDFFISIFIFTILMVMLLFIMDLRSNRFWAGDWILGGLFTSFEIILVFFIGNLVGVGSKRLSKFLSRATMIK